jgi:hypothetical protein
LAIFKAEMDINDVTPLIEEVKKQLNGYWLGEEKPKIIINRPNIY